MPWSGTELAGERCALNRSDPPITKTKAASTATVLLIFSTTVLRPLVFIGTTSVLISHALHSCHVVTVAEIAETLSFIVAGGPT